MTDRVFSGETWMGVNGYEATEITRLRETIDLAFPKLWGPTEAALATILALVPDDVVNPPTCIFTGSPSGGKSSTLEFMAGLEDLTYRSDRFTPRAFVSHAANVPRHRLEEIDLLPRIRHRAMITPELAPLFRGSEEHLTETFAILTVVLDGRGYVSDSGAQGRRGYVGDDYLFAWLGATTPLPTHVWRIMAALGSRLFFYAMPEGGATDEELEEVLAGASYRERVAACQAAVAAVLRNRWDKYGGARGVAWDRTQDPVPVRSRLKTLARLVCALRGVTSVWRDGRGDELTYSPSSIEQPFRAISCLYNLCRGRAILYGRTRLVEEDLPLVTHIALSSAPHERTTLVHALLEHGGTLTTRQAANALLVTLPTARKAMKTLDVLGVATATGLDDHGAGGHLTLRQEWVSSIAGVDQPIQDGWLEEIGGRG